MKTKISKKRGISVAVILVALTSIACSRQNRVDNDNQQLFVGDDIAVAQTQYGRVQGFILRGIYNFRGIPYGADTGGKNRFMPPQKPQPWEEVLPAVWWGNSAPQAIENKYANAWASFVDHWNYDDVSEDCLKLNIWTPSIMDDNKRPVLVWLHGGGFSSGNGIEQDGYNGENLSRKGDIVFVSLNHRLGAFGFSDLSGTGKENYAYSGNVGMLDIIAALEWVRDNIANFGGDPGNVTIMGQSGGGAKVCVLCNMPSAKGLFHKAVALSGSSLKGMNREISRKIGEYILKEAALSFDEVDKLQEMPWEDYLQLADKALRKYREENEEDSMMRFGYAPVADGVSLTSGDFFAGSDGLSSDVPMILSSTFHEWSMSRNNPEMEEISAEKAIEMLKGPLGFGGNLGEKAEEIYHAYAKIFPKAKPIEIMTLIISNRKNVIETANAKVLQKAPVYVAWFGWEPPLFNNRMRAFHCLDICFWFANTDVMLTHTGGGKRPRVLSDKMSDALLNFMETGNPNSEGLPHWPKYTKEKGETMVFKDHPEVLNDPDREARNLLP